MAKYEFSGEVVAILATRTYGKKNIQAREFRVKEPPKDANSKFSNTLPFVVSYDPTGDRYNNLPQLDAIKVGDMVKFSFTPRGREWNDPKTGANRCFIDLKVCSKIEKIGSAPELSFKTQQTSQGYDLDDMPL